MSKKPSHISVLTPRERLKIAFPVLVIIVISVVAFLFQPSIHGAIALNTIELYVGDEGQIAYYASTEDITWTVEDARISQLQGNTVKGLAPGVTVVTLQTSQDRILDTVFIHVLPVPVDQSFTVILDGIALDYDGPVKVSELPVQLKDGFTFQGIALDGTILDEAVLLTGPVRLETVYTLKPVPLLTVTVVDSLGTVVSTALVTPGTLFKTLYPEALVYAYPLTCDDAPLNLEMALLDDVTITVKDAPVACEIPVIDPPTKAPVPTPPAVYTVRLENESNDLVKTMQVTHGATLETRMPVQTRESFKGYYRPQETCENPFDLTTPITENITLIAGFLNETSPCIALNQMAFRGTFAVSETIQVHHTPTPASVRYEWFISTNNRDFRLLPQHTGPAIELTADHHRMYLAVNIMGHGDAQGTLKMGTPRIGLSSQSIESPKPEIPPVDPPAPEQPDPVIEQAIIDGFIPIIDGFIPISNKAEFAYIATTSSVTFAAGTFYELVTEGGLDKNYILVNDVTLSGVTYDKSFINDTFTGTLDGNGFELSELTIDSTANEVGLFERLDGASLKNIHITAFNITGQNRVGGLAGQIDAADYSEIINVTITNSTIVSYSNYAGGFLGQLSDSHVLISQSSFSGTVEAANFGAGGLVGQLYQKNSSLNTSKLDIFDVKVNGTIEGGTVAGGLIGRTNHTIANPYHIITIEKANVQADISGGSSLGGLIGGLSNANLTINTSSNRGDITGSSNLGGLIGHAGDGNSVNNVTDSNISITNSFNLGQVKGTTHIGGIFGILISSNNSVFTSMSAIYNVGLVTGSGSNIGGIIGYTSEPITFSGVVYLESTANLSIGAINSSPVINGSLLALSNLSMQAISTFEDLGWDIGLYPNHHADKVWAMGYTDGIKTFPWLSRAESPEDLQIAFLNAQINQSVIPLAHPEDLVNISTTSSVTFAAGTIYETVVSGGLDKDYMLVDDIDLSGLGTLTQSALDFVFTGTLDGDDYTISGLAISASSNNLGLFNKLGSGAIVQNLTLSGFNITGTGRLGLLAGSIDSSVGVSLISINTTSSHISGVFDVGGLIGEIKNSTAIQMSQLTLNGQLRHSNDNSRHFGGVVGNIENAQVSMEEVLQLGNIEATGNHIGGIVGLIRDSSIVTLSSISQHGHVTGSGAGTTDTGGLIGQVRNSSSVNIQNALNTGNVSNTNARESGGLIGRVGEFDEFGKVVITNAYNVGTVSSNGGNVGSLIGKIENANSVVTFTAVFWNTDIGSVSNSIGDTTTGAVTNGSITGVTNDAMIDIDTFNTGGADWDINSYPELEGIWTIGGADDQDTYPWLSWTEAPNESVEVDLTAILIASGYIPIASPEDFEKINSTSPRTFGDDTPYSDTFTPGLDKNYILVTDVALGTYTTAVVDDTFTGTLDGNGFELSDLTIVNGTADVGLFSKINGALITNLHINNFDISGQQRIGGIAGGIENASETRFINVHVTNSTVGASSFSVGGFTGQIRDSSVIISQSSFSGTVKSAGSQSGGLVGRIAHEDSSTTNRVATQLEIVNVQIFGTVEGSSNIGGLIGVVERGQLSEFKNIIDINQVSNYALVTGSANYIGGFVGIASSVDLTITQSENHGNVFGRNFYSGGFIGGAGTTSGSPTQSSIMVLNSLNTAEIKGNGGDIGGLIGLIANDDVFTELRAVYAFGTITGSGSDQGGIIGDLRGSITFSGVVYLVSTAGQSIGATSGSPSINGTPVAAHIAQMVSLDTFTNLGWNIAGENDPVTTWAIGYEGGHTLPYLTVHSDPTEPQLVTLNSQEQDYMDDVNNGIMLLNNKESLNLIEETGHYRLTRDIDLGGSDWEPIPNFSGTLDGNGYTISNGNIDQSGINNVGFFSQISGASIKNLTFDNFSITGGANTGLVVGNIVGGVNSITSVTVTNSSISAANSAGGFIGRNYGLSLSMNTVINGARVNSNSSRNGGFIGVSANELIVEKAINYGTISGAAQYNGGLVGILGDNSDASFSEIGNFGLINAGTDGAGGLIGGTNGSGDRQISLENGFNFGNIQIFGVDDNAGGIIGYVNSAVITFSALYSAGNITTAGYRAGLVFGLYIDADTKLSTEQAIFSLNSLSTTVDGYTSRSDDFAPYNSASTKIDENTMRLFSNFHDAGWDISQDLNGSSIWVIDDTETMPWLRWMGSPDSSMLYDEIANQISTGFIPIASKADFDNIDAPTDTVFASGTQYEGTYTPGVDKNYILITDVALGTYTAAVINGTFTGILDGNGYTLSDLTINQSSKDRLALFKELNNATIKNLGVDNFGITGATRIGVLAGRGGGSVTIENVTLSTITLNASSGRAGGLVGEFVSANVTLSNIHVSDITMTSNSSLVGGVVGFFELTNADLENILVTQSSLNGKQNVGGIIGGTSSSDKVTLNHVTYSGSVTENANSGAGGIIGLARGTITLTAITQEGSVTGTERVGGIVGRTENLNMYMENVLVTRSTISGPLNIGGIIGELYSSATAQLVNVTQNGIVGTSGTDFVGGIIGKVEGTLILSSVTQDGAVNGRTERGGIIGNVAGSNTADVSGSNISALNTGITSSSSSHKGTIIGSISSAKSMNLTGLNDGNLSSTHYVGHIHHPEYSTINEGSIIYNN